MNKVVLSVFSRKSMQRLVRVDVGPEDDISAVLHMFSSIIRQAQIDVGGSETFNIRLATFEGHVIHTAKEVSYCDVISSSSKVVEAYFKGVSVVEAEPRCIKCDMVLELKPMTQDRRHLIIMHMDLAICIPGYIEVVCDSCQTKYLFTGKPEAISLISTFPIADIDFGSQPILKIIWYR